MSTILNTIVPCEAIQAPLTRYMNTCPSSRRMGTPTLIWTNSPENKSGIQQLIQPMPGKKFTARLTYDQPRTLASVTAVESCDKVCDATTEIGDTSVDYTIECTDGLRIEEKVTLSDWNESCRGNNELIMSKLANMLDALIPAVAEKQAEELNPLIGGWSSDVNGSWLDVNDFLEVRTATSAGVQTPQWFERVSLAKMQTAFCGNTLITGGADLFSAWRLLNAGCCTTDGLDTARILDLYGEAVVYDRWIANEFGNNVSLMIQSNSIQLLQAAFNTAPLVLDPSIGLDMTYRNGFQTVIQDPVTGILVDLNIKEDCGVVHIVMTATTKTVGLPNNLYPEGHPNEFVNFVTGVIVDNS